MWSDEQSYATKLSSVAGFTVGNICDTVKPRKGARERGVKILPYSEILVKVVSFSHKFPLRSVLDIARGHTFFAVLHSIS